MDAAGRDVRTQVAYRLQRADMNSQTEASRKPDNRRVADWERQDGFVYFIGAGDPPEAIKIGIAIRESMLKRLKALQTSNHQPLHILGLVYFANEERPMASANALEKALHEKYESSRRLVNGPGNEWFSVSVDLLAEIENVATDPTAYDVPRTIATLGPGLAERT
jgi:hypothetical protein